MKVKKILVYVGVALTAAVTGALIASPEFRGKVGNSVKGGMNWIGGKIKKNEGTAACEETPEPEPEKPQESNENQNRGGGYYRNKPRYNNNNRNNNNN